MMQATWAETAVVREAGEDDLEAVIDVLRAANAEFADLLPAALYRAFLANSLDVRGRLADSRLLVAEHEGRIVGTATLYPDASREGWDWPAHWAGIRAVAVAPSARGLGIGRRLTRECIERARALGVLSVCIHTGSFMTAAMSLYEGLGFRRAPEFDLDLGVMFDAGATDSSITVYGYRLDLLDAPMTDPARW
jgi:GNAT superfamily N-acetyltransferase